MLQHCCVRRMLLTPGYRRLPCRQFGLHPRQASQQPSTPTAARRRKCTAAHAVKSEVDPSGNGATPEIIERIEERDIQKEASESFIAYAMSVVVGRALPDVRDGLKPAHRRIIFAMHELGLVSNKPHKKCARVVGEVLGKFHPHGDSAVYQALVRMAQDFSMRAPLVSGHGNFGSVDNDPAAAMRYTECRLEPISMDMLLSQLGKNSVDEIPTFDGSMNEPTVLPAKIPNILVNGSSGIAVGMATKMPPHNISEVINALQLLIDNPYVTIEELLDVMPGPDFPTGGEIVLKQGLRDTYLTGRGSILMRGKVSMEGGEDSKKKRGAKRASTTQSIVINELPYQICKADLVEAIAGLVEDHKIDGISDVRDESDREGIRVVVDVKRGTEAQIVLNNLYKRTKLQSSFSCNMVALVNGVPRTMNLKQILQEFLDFRCIVVTRRAKYIVKEIEDRLHIVEGFLKAMKSMGKIIDTIRNANDSADARSKLTSLYDLSHKQASSVLDLPLVRLTSIETKKLQAEQEDLITRRLEHKGLLEDRRKLLKSIQKETAQFQKKFGDDRRSVMVKDPGDLSDMDVLSNEPNLVVFSKNGFIKRMRPNTFVARKRGGVGVYGANLRQDDSMGEIVHAMLHDQLLFFTESGIVYSLRSYQIPMASRKAMGTPVAQVLPGLKEDPITRIMALNSMDPEKDFLLMLTEKGRIKRTPYSSFKNVRVNGLIALKVQKGDKLKWVGQCSEDMTIFVTSSRGNAIRFQVNQKNLRPQSRTAAGTKAMKLIKGSEIVALEVLPQNPESLGKSSSSDSDSESSDDQEVSILQPSVLMITSKGLGKRVPIEEFPSQVRGGVGRKGLLLNPGDTLVVAMLVGIDPDKSELVIASQQGMVTRTSISAIPIYRRYSKGVKVMNLKEGDFVKDVTATIIDQQELDSMEENAPLSEAA